jgi:NAD(P)-dependent dehydrogenase (short-subunit alcohol dehydrogenase family)
MEQVAVVTGANRGIGLETAARLADLGYIVVFIRQGMKRRGKRQ